MTYARPSPTSDLGSLPRMPLWVTSTRSESPEYVTVLLGAALSHLHKVLSRNDVPQSLLRDRLALRAAEACVTGSAGQGRLMQVRLEKIIPPKRQHRFYVMQITRTLFGEWCLIREWGRIGSGGGQRLTDYSVANSVERRDGGFSQTQLSSELSKLLETGHP